MTKICRYAQVQNFTVVNIIDAPEDFILEGFTLVKLGEYKEDSPELLDPVRVMPSIGWSYYEDEGFEDPKTDAKNLLAHLANLRYTVEVGGTIVNGIRVATDRHTQSVMTALYVTAQASPDEMISFKGSDGFVRVTAGDMLSIIEGVRKHVQLAFQAEHVVADRILSEDVTTFVRVEEEFSVAFNSEVFPGAS